MTFVLIIGHTHYAIVSQRALICQYPFVESAKEEVPLFYKDVGEHLRAWVPPPPKLKREVASEADKRSTIVQKEAEQSLSEVEKTNITVAEKAIDEKILTGG